MVLKELGVKGTDAVFYQSTKRDRVVFVDEVPPGLLCPVCRDVFIAPKIATCGHPVCEECVRKVVKQTGKCFSCSAFGFVKLPLARQHTREVAELPQ